MRRVQRGRSHAMTTDEPRQPTALPQGDLRLLETDQARRLLAAALPARYAYTARDGTPRVLPSWFHWTGEELVMPTFVSAPHVRQPARRPAALAEIDRPGTRMARIALRPTWVGLLDFQTRVPGGFAQ